MLKITDALKTSFLKAADQLVNQGRSTGFASTGVKVLNFRTKDGQRFIALEQNPDRVSTGAQLARSGEKVALIRHADPKPGEYALIGFAIPDQNTFAAFQTGGLGSPGEEVNIDDIGGDVGDVKVINSNAFQGKSDVRPETQNTVRQAAHQGGQGQRGNQGQQGGRGNIAPMNKDIFEEAA